MRLGTCEENGVEGIFYLSPLEEMVFAMHVLAEPAHHLARAQWAAGAAHAAGSALMGQLGALSGITRQWLVLADLGQAEPWCSLLVPDALARLAQWPPRRWAELFSQYGQRPSAAQCTAILGAMQAFYTACFEQELPRCLPLLRRILEQDLARCREQGLFAYLDGLHARLRTEDGGLVFAKNREYRFPRGSFCRVYITASTFAGPHLMLGQAADGICVVRNVQLEKTCAAPRDLVEKLQALGDGTRLRILRLAAARPVCTQALAQALHLSEGCVSKHLHKLEAAGFLDRRRRGGYVDYCLRAEEVDFLTYRIFEYLL